MSLAWFPGGKQASEVKRNSLPRATLRQLRDTDFLRNRCLKRIVAVKPEKCSLSDYRFSRELGAETHNFLSFLTVEVNVILIRDQSQLIAKRLSHYIRITYEEREVEKDVMDVYILYIYCY